MKFSGFYILICSVFLLNGCLTGDKDKDNKKNKVEVYKLDLDNDTIEEVVEVEDRYLENNDIAVKITKNTKAKDAKNKTSIFTVPGHFDKTEFIDLDYDGFKQIALYYDTKDSYSGLDIYKIKNNKVTKIFSIKSTCDIDTEFDSTIARVKVGKGKDGSRECSVNGVTVDWEVWVWSGDKFIKER